MVFHMVLQSAFLKTTVLASRISVVEYPDSRTLTFIGNLSLGLDAHEQVWGISNRTVMCSLHGI